MLNLMLILYVSSYYISGYFVSNCSDKVTIAPKSSTPKMLLQPRVFFENLARAYTLHCMHNSCRRTLRWSTQKNINMVWHKFHRIYLKFVLLGYFLEKLFNSFLHLIFQNTLAILWNSDNVIFDVIHRMFRSLNSHAEYFNIIRAFGAWAFNPALKSGAFCPRLL